MKMKPTKEEILKSKFKNSFLDLDYLELYLEAMQEYAELYHKEKLREELIKFAEWYDGDIIPKELIVDKYLTPKG